MRIRTIKPEFWDHPVMGKQSDATKLLAIGLLNIADDQGFFYADPKLIRNSIRPFDDNSGITTVAIRDLSKIGYIQIRNHPTHGEIGKVVSFSDHQVINKAKSSKLSKLWEYGSDPVLIPDEDGRERKGMEGKGMDLLSDESDDVAEYSDFIERLWRIFPAKSRNRSSKAKLDQEWKKIRPKPPEQRVIEMAAKWSAIDDWKKEGGQFAPGAHIWIKDRKWESEPLAISSVKSNGMSAAEMGLS